MPFAKYPTVFAYEKAGDTEPKEHLLWGDSIELLGGKKDDWVEVKARNSFGWMREKDIQDTPILEVDFVDVQQGDSAFIVTPDNRHVLIDAGEHDNMYRLLNWRFKYLRGAPVKIDTAVITHSDADHSKGFGFLFDDPRYSFGQIYHNGLFAQSGGKLPGTLEASGGQRYVTELVLDRDALDGIADTGTAKRSEYTKMLQDASRAGRLEDIRMLCSEDCFLPGYDDHTPLAIRVLGPVPEKGADGKRRLRWLKGESETKNGHSITLRVEYGKVRILLGGDLNSAAEAYLLQHYTHLDPEAAHTPAERDALVQAARQTFEADVAKACHHGSSDFTELFLQGVNAVATVVSSGDDETYAHPRPDALGAMGKYGRGRRPLIFSTELARSSKDVNKHPEALRKQINALANDGELIKSKAKREAEMKKLLDKLGRSVAVYGMVNLRTDGTRVLLAYKLERATRTGNQWDVHLLEPGAGGGLEYVSKYLQ